MTYYFVSTKPAGFLRVVETAECYEIAEREVDATAFYSGPSARQAARGAKGFFPGRVFSVFSVQVNCDENPTFVKARNRW